MFLEKCFNGHQTQTALLPWIDSKEARLFVDSGQGTLSKYPLSENGGGNSLIYKI